ncbi:MAG: hypothetical protein AB3N21_19435 [Ruegeria sp.]|uniref:hypothetical protein n=1 Tax=Ruegeria sp. TaxID=1879320 RepID=UPI00349E7B30
MRHFFHALLLSVMACAAYADGLSLGGITEHWGLDDEDEDGGGLSSTFSGSGSGSGWGGSSGIIVAPTTPDPRPVARPTPPASTGAISDAHSLTRGGAIAEAAAADGVATRIFAGPGMFPPEHFAAYAIVAFTSRPLPQDRERFLEICRGYVAAILAYSEVEQPLDQQLVTVWPVNQDYVGIDAMAQPGSEGCNKAVDEYGLATSLSALRDAYLALDPDDIATLTIKRGPFVLAWSPTHQKGTEDALILRMDLSGVETATQAREKFEAWRDEIEAKQHLWIDGWKEDTLADMIGNWADRWGGDILALLRRD